MLFHHTAGGFGIAIKDCVHDLPMLGIRVDDICVQGGNLRQEIVNLGLDCAAGLCEPHGFADGSNGQVQTRIRLRKQAPALPTA